MAPLAITRRALLVTKVTLTGEDHRCAALISGSDHFVVAD